MARVSTFSHLPSHLRALLSSMSIAPPPATTLEFFSARRTIMMASCSERSASSRNCRATSVHVSVYGGPRASRAEW